MDKRKFVQNLTIIVLAVAIIVMSVGYAIYYQPMDLTGTTTIQSSSWNIHFANIKSLPTTTVAAENITGPTLTKTTSLSFGATLNLGEVYEFTVDVENTGTFDALLDSVGFTATKGSETLATTGNQYDNGYLEYSVKYADGTEIQGGDTLDSKTNKTVKVSVKYKQPDDASILPEQAETYTFKIDLRYVQA